ncbi:MAG: DUF2232 domain-containing protein [Deltaproteobacteria bacterium]|nr:DUF2232 domain-containing protein [Deltaproteobacteria bacterium]
MKNFSILFPNNSFLKILLIISFFVFVAAFIPVIGSICLLFLPMILFLNGTVNDRIKTTAAFLISFSLLVLLAPLLRMDLPVIAIFTMGMAGLLVHMIAVQNGSVEKTIIYPAIFIIAAICLYFIYGGFVLSVNPWQLVEKYIASTIEENVKLYSQLPLKAEDINFIQDNKKNIIDGLTRIFPAIIVMGSAFIIWINFLLGKRILNKAGIIYPVFATLAHWKASESIIWIFIISGALFFVPHKDANFIGLNIFLVMCFVYFLQGLAIVSFFFQKKNAPLFFRYIFYFLIAVQQFLVIPIAIIGLFDIWIDFRKFFQKDQTTA